MDLASFRLLQTPAGQDALSVACALEPREVDFLRHFATLSRRFPAGLARAALETAILRRSAAVKFPLAERMYFTREALEQASGYEVSGYRARRFHDFARLLDLGCSIGGDTLALAQVAPTLGVDLDPLRLAIASANLDALGLSGRARFVQADLAAGLPVMAGDRLGLFFDPARRAAGRRKFSVRDYHPPLGVIQAWLLRTPALGIKLSPGVESDEIDSYPAEIEFISLRGELKEATLWFGSLKTAHRRATLLPGPHSLTEADLPGRPASIAGAPQAYLYEPDPAVLRAGLVTALGAHLEALQLDPQIAYLTAAQKTPTPFARVWAVEDWLPFGMKRLRAYLRARGIGRVVVKKRGSPLEPEAVIHDLRLSGDAERVIFLTRMNGKPVVVVCLPEERRAREQPAGVSAPGD